MAETEFDVRILNVEVPLAINPLIDGLAVRDMIGEVVVPPVVILEPAFTFITCNPD